MHLMIETKEGYCDRIKIECSAVEYLVIQQALKQFAENNQNTNHLIDVGVAEKMLKVEPLFYDR